MKSRAKRHSRWRNRLRGAQGFLGRMLVVMTISLIGIVLIASACVLYFEKAVPASSGSIRNFGDAIWWAIVTVATVGYGDVVPHTLGGRDVGIVLIIVGFVIAPLLTGLIASKMVDDKLKGARGLKPLTCKNHILICGWYEIGHTVLKALTEREFPEPVALVSDITPEAFAELQAHYPSLELLFIRGDFSQRETLLRANLKEAQHVLILPDQSLPKQAADDRSVVVASAVRFLSSSIMLTVQLLRPENRSHLEHIGVDNIVIFNEFGGYLLAHNVVNNYYASFTHKLIQEQDVDIQSQKIPHGFVGKTWGELSEYLVREENIIPLGIVSERQRLELADIFGDDNSSIDAFIRSALERARSRMPEQRTNLKLKPPKDYVIGAEDEVLILG